MDRLRKEGSEGLGSRLVLANNAHMLKRMKSPGFAIKTYEEDPDFKLVTHLLG